MSTAPNRIRAEAQFQTARTTATVAEPRDKFYVLVTRARHRYSALLGDVAGKTILVVGCAEGGVTPLARKGASVIGIDISFEAIRRLRQAITKEGVQGRATVLVMDAEHPALSAGAFDIICCTGVLHHLDVEQACRSWSAILKPGGMLIMMEPMAWNPVVALYRLFTPASRTIDEHPLKPGDIKVLRQFFGSVEVEGFVLTSAVTAALAFLPRLSSLWLRSIRLLERFDDGLLALAPGLRYLCWTSVIRCSGVRGEVTLQPPVLPSVRSPAAI